VRQAAGCRWDCASVGPPVPGARAGSGFIRVSVGQQKFANVWVCQVGRVDPDNPDPFPIEFVDIKALVWLKIVLDQDCVNRFPLPKPAGDGPVVVGGEES
jgi:hypothetical protein